MNDILTNGTEIKQRILLEINQAHQNIYVAMAYFTDREIAMAIINAKARNILVDIILSSNNQNDTVKLMLRGANINVHAFDTGDARGIMHHKFCLIDNRITINGSYNYSINASNNNVENIHVSDDPKIYNQFYSEFERLKFNIDNNIAVNTVEQVNDIGQKSNQNPNYLENFTQQLDSLIFSSVKLNVDDYKRQGYEHSKKSQGSIVIFKSEFRNIEDQVKVLATEDGLNSKKQVLTSNILSAFEAAKSDLESDCQNKIETAQKNHSLEKKQIEQKLPLLQDEISVLESGNKKTGDRGLVQVNNEIEKSILEKKSLEQSFIVKKFWSVGTILVSIGLFFCFFYLSIFFASAVYKVFFEGNVIRASIEAGLNPGLPQIVDANAVIKIFRQQGILFGFMSGLFFLIPVSLSNLKVLGSDNKLVNSILFWVGLLIFDILVSIMVAFNTDEIKSLIAGKTPDLKLWEVVKHGEFWLIFVFGMFPLIITHFLIENIVTAYNASRPDLVDGEKANKLKFLELQLIDLNTEKDIISKALLEKTSILEGIQQQLNLIDSQIIKIEDDINSLFSQYQKQLKSVYEEYNARIISGKIFTVVLLDSISTAFKSGFIEYLPEYYASEEIRIRVTEIEQFIKNNTVQK